MRGLICALLCLGALLHEGAFGWAKLLSNSCRRKGWGVVLTAQILRIGTPHADTAPSDPSDSRTCAVVSRAAPFSESEDARGLR